MNMNDNTDTFLSLVVSGCVKPFIIKQLCLHFLHDNENREYPNGLQCVVARRKPLLRHCQKAAHLKYAKQH